MSIDEQIAVMKAYSEGKTIQSRVKDRFVDEWTDVPDPHWNFGEWDYRVKPENEGAKAERMTNRQLAEWLAKGNGDWNMTDSNYPGISYVFNSDEEDEPVDEKARVRRFGSDEWIVPTKEIYDRDCAEKGFSDFFYNLISGYNGCNHDDDDDEDEGKKSLILGDTDLASRYIGKTGWFADSLEVLKRGKEKNPRLRYHGVLKDVRGFRFSMVSDRKYEGEYIPYAFFMPDEVLK